MSLDALERPESLVYNAPEDIGIRPIFVKLQYKTSASYTVIGDTEKYRYFLCTTVVPYRIWILWRTEQFKVIAISTT